MDKLKAILRDKKGSIFIISTAIIVAVISLISSASLINLVSYDSVNLSYQMDMIQEDILIRSEMTRSDVAMRLDKDHLADRYVTVDDGDFVTTYTVETDLAQWTEESNLRNVIRTLVTANRGKGVSNRQESPIRRFVERLVQKTTLAQFQYFTDIEKSENEDGGFDASLVKFWGPDEFWGPVHSNDDIWIQNGGGGDNGGWPTFHDSVTTVGHFLRYNTGEDLENDQGLMEQIFQGGWKSESRYWSFNATADDIHKNGLRLFPGPEEIVYVKLNGNTFTTWLGDVVVDSMGTFPVYSWFPADEEQAQMIVDAGGNWYEDADLVWTNYVPIYDTLWTEGPTGNADNQSFYTDKELWIEGSVAGKQTWCSADTVFIVGDIYYENTPFGEPPDEDGSENPTDYFGLVSEQKILVRYKHTDPETGERVANNLDGVTIYGAYAAIAQGDPQIHGDMACHYDGIFTFQYHHQHGSTPDFWGPSPYTGIDTLYTFVDLHKYIFPPSSFIPDNVLGFAMHGGSSLIPPLGMCGYPYEDPGYIYSYPNNAPYAYPYGTDYPWYNPVWPESAADMILSPTDPLERGELNIFGAIAQRRRGFIHRSGSDPYNHPNETEWDLEAYHFDGNHPPVGYDKNYRFDNRFRTEAPPDFPRIYDGFGEANYLLSGEAWVFKTPPSD